MNFRRTLPAAILCLLYLAFSAGARAQLIKTVAGNGAPGYAGDGGPAASSHVLNPTGVAVDAAGNLYIADTENSRIRVVNTGNSSITVANVTIAAGNIATVAGTGTAGFTGDGGQATNAQIHNPSSVAVDGAGNIYFVDLYNYRIRKVNPAGIISTVTGNGNSNYSGDGPASAAALFPYDAVVDSHGNLYIADTYLNAIRVINLGGTPITVAGVTIPPGNIATVAGNGTYGSGGDGGPALSAQFDNPYGVAVDTQGNIYICDTYNRRIRVVNAGTSAITVANVTIQPGNIQTVAGDGAYWHRFTGPALTAEFADPDGVFVDSAGNIYVSDTENSSVHLVDHKTGFIITIAGGSGVYGYNGDNIPAVIAELAYPRFMAMDAAGNLYLADQYNERIFEIPVYTLTRSITSSATTAFVAGAPGSFAVTTNYWPTPTLTVSGSLPDGVSFTDNGNGTATLAGTPLVGNGSYPLTFKASNGVYQDVLQTFTLTIYPQGGSPVASAATLVSIDTQTSGNWKAFYGTDGYSLAGLGTQVLPFFATMSVQNQQTYVWFGPSVPPPAGELLSDSRALQLPDSSARILATWETDPTFTIDLNLTDANSHQITLYALDWDYRGRLETVQVQDADTGFPLYETPIYNFAHGAYLVWNIRGHVKFVITRIGGVDSMLSGVFFGGNAISAPVITQQPQSVTVNAGATATFTVGAAGGGLSYQWQSKPAGAGSFSAIVGATASSYTTPALALADSGIQLKCVVTNSVNSVASNAATVTVSSPLSIAVTPANPTVLPGGPRSLTATGTYAGGATQNITSQVTWGSSNASAATVSNLGVVSALATGSSTISATLNGISGSTVVTVPALNSIAVTPASPTVLPGATQSLAATGTYAGGGTQDITSQVTWSSTILSVATVSSTGAVTAIGTGTSTISALLNGVSGSTVVTVPALSSIAVSPLSPTVIIGGMQQFTATGTYQGGATQNITTQVTWSSSKPAIAAIGSTGLATMLSAGSTTISAAAVGFSGSTNLAVPPTLPQPSGLVLYWTLNTADDSAGVALDRSNNNGNGTIHGTPAQVTGKLNEALVFNGVTSFVSVGSSADPSTSFINSVTLGAWINTVNTSRLEAIISKYDASGGGWGYIFRTDAAGHLELVLGGNDIHDAISTAVDTATVNDGQWHYVVAVITIGQDVKFYVDGIFSSATAIRSTASGDNFANVNVGLNPWAPFGNYFTGMIDDVRLYNRALNAIEVNTLYLISGGPPLTSITVTPLSPAVSVGGTQQFVATGAYQGGATQNISSLVTWNSSDTTAATINGVGLATAKSVGSSTISASQNGTNSNGVTLTVQPPPPPVCPCTIWPSSAVPTLIDAGAGAGVELGVKFKSDVSGTITGVRFYKSAANTGTHVGNLWSSNGTLLATATFTSESASGWQQVNFSPAVAITANTVYVASYHTNVSHFSLDLNAFASSGVDTPPLHALSNGASGGNGLYLYSGTSGFPTNTYNASNYWVDVVFSTAAASPLVSIAVSPSSPTINVGATRQFTATGTYQDSSTQDISAQVTWSSANTTAATINSAGLATGKAVGSSNITAALNSITSNSATLTVQAGSGSTCPCTIWPSSAIPSVVDSGAGGAVELGVKFKSDVSGMVTGIRFYKSAANTGTHIGNLWSSNGTLLATATFTSESASGWQQVNFSPAVAIAANTVYVASYHTNVSHFSLDLNAFTSTGVDTPPLHALANGVSGGDGLYLYSGTSGFPTNTYNASNYWVDVVFSDTTPPPPTCPCTIWSNSAVPSIVDAGAGPGVELGVKFRSDSSGTITGMRFYKSAANTGTHVGNLWSSNGTLLATATFTSESASGWQQVSFSPAVAITANTVYVVSYYTSVSHFSLDLNAFTSAGVDNAPLHALINGLNGGNGLYLYGNASGFPINTFNGSNYWVDVIFQ